MQLINKILPIFVLSGMSLIVAGQTTTEHTEHTNTDIEFTDVDKVTAASWQLTRQEWLKYKQIMRGPASAHNPNMDPLTALGIYSENKEERCRMAELWVQAEYDFGRRLGDFLEAKIAAERRLYPNVPVLDMARYQRILASAKTGGLEHQSISTGVSAGDELHLFVTQECKSCVNAAKRLFPYIKKGVTLNIYFSDATDKVIRDWASQMQISPDDVRARKITLNHAGQLLATLNVANYPALYKGREGLPPDPIPVP